MFCISRNKIYLIVDFDVDLPGVHAYVVPRIWMTCDKLCYWPSFPGTTKNDTAVRELAEPQSYWPQHRCEIITAARKTYLVVCSANINVAFNICTAFVVLSFDLGTILFFSS